MKQYVVSYAYVGNTKVHLYENGVLINSVIVADYDIPGYVSCLQSQGYVEAFDVEAAQEKVDAARDTYTAALEALEVAKASPLVRAEG